MMKSAIQTLNKKIVTQMTNLSRVKIHSNDFFFCSSNRLKVSFPSPKKKGGGGKKK